MDKSDLIIKLGHDSTKEIIHTLNDIEDMLKTLKVSKPLRNVFDEKVEAIRTILKEAKLIGNTFVTKLDQGG